MKLFDNSEYEMTIAKDCPWHEAQQTFGAPNVNWCEKTTCSYISEPANTWSNLVIIFFAVLIITKFKNSIIKIFGACVLLMGIGSGVYHATNNFLSQYIDFLGMSLVSSFLISFAVFRIFKERKRSFYFYFFITILLNAIFLSLMEKNHMPLQMTFIIQFGLVFGLETIALLQTKKIKFYKNFFISIFLIVIAQAAAQIDLKRIYCNPENIILHGHVFWHAISAIALYFASLHINEMLKINKIEQKVN